MKNIIDIHFRFYIFEMDGQIICMIASYCIQLIFLVIVILIIIYVPKLDKRVNDAIARRDALYGQ